VFSFYKFTCLSSQCGSLRSSFINFRLPKLRLVTSPDKWVKSQRQNLERPLLLQHTAVLCVGRAARTYTPISTIYHTTANKCKTKTNYLFLSIEIKLFQKKKKIKRVLVKSEL